MWGAEEVLSECNVVDMSKDSGPWESGKALPPGLSGDVDVYAEDVPYSFLPRDVYSLKIGPL